MMYKLITIDIDGTLLDSYGNVSDITRSTIKKAKEKGVEIVLASGRPIKSTLSIAKELDISNYIISGNGSVLLDVNQDKFVFEGFMDKEEVLEIAKFCEENSIYYNVYTTKEIVCSQIKFNTIFYHTENIYKPISKRTDINLVENTYKYIKKLQNPKFLKITIADENENIFNNIIKKLKERHDLNILDTSYMSRKIIRQGSFNIEVNYYYTEITKGNINKWSAIEALAKKLKIKNSEIISIGDNFNDREMIEKAGLGVAMDNASDDVKEIANYVTENNNEDGVAKAISKFIDIPLDT